MRRYNHKKQNMFPSFIFITCLEISQEYLTECWKTNILYRFQTGKLALDVSILSFIATCLQAPTLRTCNLVGCFAGSMLLFSKQTEYKRLILLLYFLPRDNKQKVLILSSQSQSDFCIQLLQISGTIYARYGR